MNELSGARVLVTGASRGIGLGVARAFVEAGATVWTLAEDGAVHEAARGIGATGLVADVTEPEAVAEALAQAGPLDVLVNNAGLERLTPVDDASPEAIALFRRIMDINVAGMAIVTAHALPRLTEGARIVNTASIWGRVGEPLFAAYVASKHAVIGLIRGLSEEYMGGPVTFNAICPGYVDTPIVDRNAAEIAEVKSITDEEARAYLARGNRHKRLLETEEVTATALWLCSDAARSVNGQAIQIAGGQVA